jgi:choline kinase
VKGNRSTTAVVLVSVNGRSILERLITALQGNAIERAVFAVGYRHDAIEEAIRLSAPRLPFRFALNPDYLTTGTARSLLLGLHAAEPGGDVVVVEGDVLFDPAIVAAIMSRQAAAATALARWAPEHSGSCAVLDGGRVAAWIHETHRPAGFDPSPHYKTVNITWLSREAWATALLPTLEETLSEEGPRAPAEYAFHRLVTKGTHPVEGVVIDPCNWWEVDTPEDLHIARELFA